MKVLAIDFGFGDNKVVFGDESQIYDMYKFPSVLAKVHVNELVKDSRVVSYEDSHYYVGDDALAVESNSIMDINNYSMLEFAAPIFLYKILSKITEGPDKIVIGLSISHIRESGHFKSRIIKFLRGAGVNLDIELVPQGLTSKLTIDKFGVEFPDLNDNINRFSNYIGCDIGFNTLDIFQVIRGKASSNLVRGIPERGIQVIVSRLVEFINSTYKIKISMSEGRESFITGTLRRRGKSITLTEIISQLKAQYVEELKILIENEFGNIMDKSDALILTGGGSYSLVDQEDEFIKVPKNSAEFYNVIGFYLKGITS